MSTQNAKIQIRRDTASHWSSNNPVLAYGEIGLETSALGLLRFKMGDGTKTWNQLPYAASSPKKYLVTLTQTGTSAPTKTLFENTLGVTPTYAYVSTGHYTLTATGAFTDPVPVVIQTGPLVDSVHVVGVARVDSNTLSITTSNVGGATAAFADDVLLNTTLEILIYPSFD